MRYLLIPGNPPAAHFYKLWGQEISSIQPGAEVRVSPYPNLPHSINSPTEISNQILASHTANLLDFYKEQDAPITLIGHSLGGYYALKILEESSHMVEDAILLHPFLRAPHWRGKALLKSVRTMHSSALLKSLILKSRKYLEVFSSELPNVTDEELFSTFLICRMEDDTISKDNQPVVIKPNLKDKLKVFYAKNDTWCSPAVISDLKSQVYTSQCSEPHGFITDKTHRESLFYRIMSCGRIENTNAPSDYESPLG